MRKAWWMIGAAAMAALVLLVTPITVTMSRAQIGPGLHQAGMGQPLDQLTGDDFDKAFLMQMTMHHAMGVMMTQPVLANATHPELKTLAASIIDDQTREIGQMRAWAREWYGLEIPDMLATMTQMHGQGAGAPGMHQAGMGMGAGMGAGMPMHQQSNMPMHQQGNMGHMGDMSMMAGLSSLPPQRLEAVFMSQMIPHHQGALDMAALAADRAAHQELKDMAKNITTSQSAEIDQMNGWLKDWYGL